VPDVLRLISDRFVPTIIEALRQEYPNAPRHVMRSAADVATPRQLHPAFYGCFDWHSAVEMHWALAVLTRRYPDSAHAAPARAVLAEHLTAANLSTEADYLRDNPGYERPYGWGWALALAAELADWAATGDADAAAWSAALAPLAEVVEQGFVEWLPDPAYPDRTGMHSNSAFALARALPWARRGDGALLAAIERAARRWFLHDDDYSSAFEPGGSDFLSPTLTEMVLMRELLDDRRYGTWVDGFNGGILDDLAEPAEVTDDQDGQGAHLHGLNLYRVHAFRLLAERDAEPDRREAATDALTAHLVAATEALMAKGWMAEHWLAAYGVLAFG